MLHDYARQPLMRVSLRERSTPSLYAIRCARRADMTPRRFSRRLSSSLLKTPLLACAATPPACQPASTHDAMPARGAPSYISCRACSSRRGDWGDASRAFCHASRGTMARRRGVSRAPSADSHAHQSPGDRCEHRDESTFSIHGTATRRGEDKRRTMIAPRGHHRKCHT